MTATRPPIHVPASLATSGNPERSAREREGAGDDNDDNEEEEKKARGEESARKRGETSHIRLSVRDVDGAARRGCTREEGE